MKRSILFLTSFALLTGFAIKYAGSQSQPKDQTLVSAEAPKSEISKAIVLGNASANLIQPAAQPNQEYEPTGESFASIEGSLSSLSEQELRVAAKQIDEALAPQIKTANLRALTLEEQKTLTESMRRQSAIYKQLAERSIERMRKRL